MKMCSCLWLRVAAPMWPPPVDDRQQRHVSLFCTCNSVQHANKYVVPRNWWRAHLAAWSSGGGQVGAQECLALGPAIVYNVPGRTGQDIPDEVIMALAESDNFLGVKECTGNQRIQVSAPSSGVIMCARSHSAPHQTAVDHRKGLRSRSCQEGLTRHTFAIEL